MFTYIKRLSFTNHLIIALVLRLLLIWYSVVHDRKSEVLYTDVDYEVVTDGARYIIEGNSPFLRHTYRYSPLLALLLTPNILWHKCIGKIIFSLFDIFCGILIYAIVKDELKKIYYETADALFAKRHQVKYYNKRTEDLRFSQKYTTTAIVSALFWLYNPLSMGISTRGSGDSFSCFFVLGTLYFIQKYQATTRHYFLAGLCHGIAIHLRLYPIFFSLSYFLSISKSNQIFKDILLLRFTRYQIALVLGTLLSLTTLTGAFYYQYGYEYIYEAYLYHFTRKDIRHNFSLFFLTQYLNMNFDTNFFEKLFLNLPQFIVIIYITLTLGRHYRTLVFAIFAQTFVIVSYNSVVTSQYFIWYLAIFPLCLKNLNHLPIKLAILYFVLWTLAQALWLLPAYLLEFKTLNTFNFIGILGIAFFFVNIFLLQKFIKHFNVISRVKSK